MKKAVLVLGLVAANLFTVGAFAQTKPDGTAGTVNQPNMSPSNQPSLTDSQGLVGKDEKAQANVDRKAAGVAAAHGPQMTDASPQRIKVKKTTKHEKMVAAQNRKAEGAAAAKEPKNDITPDPTGMTKPASK